MPSPFTFPLVYDASQRKLPSSPKPPAVEARLATCRLRLGGLHCSACAGVIENALLREAGVLHASVNHATQRAEVRWDEAQNEPSRLIEAIVRAGYQAALDVAEDARVLRLREERQASWRLFVAAFCMMQTMMYAAPLYLASPATLPADLRLLLQWAAWLLSMPVVVFAAAPLFGDAWHGIRQGQLRMDVPVVLGITVTFIVSSVAAFDPAGAFGDATYFDSLTMFVFFLLGGRYLVLKGRHRVAATLEDTVARAAQAARRLGPDGRIERVARDALCRNDTVRVLTGDAFPADGRLVEGETVVDEAMLTGESRPVRKVVGDEAVAGSLNLGPPVSQRVERIGADTRYEGLLALMRQALTDRPPLVLAADRIAGPFLWGVLLLAATAAAVWSLVDPSRAVWVAVSVLIVTCPCALSLAAPSALLGAASALARRGVLVQRLASLEALARLYVICFDKTGTLTEGHLVLAEVHLEPAAAAAGFDRGKVTAIAGSLAAQSSHPLSRALAEGSNHMAAPTGMRWSHVTETIGSGMEAIADGNQAFRLGSRAWTCGGEGAESAAGAAHVWLSRDRTALARFEFQEVLRKDARSSLQSLRDAGLGVVLLSGDGSARVREIADKLGIADARGDAAPADKLAAMSALQRTGHRVAMVGDGLNDAPVMAHADVSIAIGTGADLTRAKADIILMSGRLSDVPFARATACRAMRIVRQNFAWAVAYNVACVPLALVGWFPPWAAGLGMATSSLVVIVNSMRIDAQRAVSSPGIDASQ